METQLPMSFMQTIFAACLFSLTQLADLPSLLLIYVKFKLPVHDHIAYCL